MDYSNQLIDFAKRVLRALEQSEDWDADMLEEIGEHAYSLGLASHDDEGMFRITDAIVRSPKDRQ